MTTSAEDIATAKEALTEWVWGKDVEVEASCWADQVITALHQSGFSVHAEPMFQGWPDAWWEDPTWLCVNGHVSKRYLKSEARGMGVCLACQEPVRLVSPDTVEDYEKTRGLWKRLSKVKLWTG